LPCCYVGSAFSSASSRWACPGLRTDPLTVVPPMGAALPAKERAPGAEISRDDLGFLLAKAMQRWNELLAERFTAAGYADVRPAYGSVLLPLYEEDGLRMGELARRARLSKQTMTDMVRRLERAGLVDRRLDERDARASLISLTARSRALEPVVAATLAELDALVRKRLSPKRVDELKNALRELVDLD
jgi:DNA-binding MarR family transcriptional regulator